MADARDYWASIEDMLAFAIDREQEAVDFYGELAGTATDESMRSVFENFAKEEQGHKAKLMKVQETGGMSLTSGTVPDLGISDYLVDIEPSPGMSYQDALVVAMKREQSAHDLYSDIAAATNEEDIRLLMLGLADEEAKHKLRFEKEYDDNVLRDN